MIDENAIIVFEYFISVTLPGQYRKYLADTNGSKFGPSAKNIFHIPGQGDDAVNRFFSLVSKNKQETLTYQLKQYQKRMPGEMLPIGNDAGGNLIIMAIKGPQRGRIFFWDHGIESNDEDQPHYKNIVKISDEFSDFIEGLRYSSSDY